MAKTHVIDGKTYIEVERKAEVGEKIVAFKYTGESTKPGDILTCVCNDEYDDGSIDAETSDGYVRFFDSDIDEYRVLVPIFSADTEPTLELTANDIRWQPDKVIDLLANLARRVSSLEEQLKDTQGNVERQGVEIAELKHLAESNEEDIRQLDERTQVVNAIQKYYGGAR